MEILFSFWEKDILKEDSSYCANKKIMNYVFKCPSYYQKERKIKCLLKARIKTKSLTNGEFPVLETKPSTLMVVSTWCFISAEPRRLESSLAFFTLTLTETFCTAIPSVESGLGYRENLLFLVSEVLCLHFLLNMAPHKFIMLLLTVMWNGCEGQFLIRGGLSSGLLRHLGIESFPLSPNPLDTEHLCL